MFEALERLPIEEMRDRQAKCRSALAATAPRAGGLLVFSRLAIYYLTGSWANGVLWLPLNGEAVLCCRKGRKRAELESPLTHIVSFRSFGDLAGLCEQAGSPLAPVCAAEQSGLSWNLAELLAARLPGVSFGAGDAALAVAQARKSEWELAKIRLCGARHAKGLMELLPAAIAPGMSEREIARKCWDAFFDLGHQGMLRMSGGDEIFLGHIAAGDSGNYPSVFNGPVGLRGEHPAIPFSGYAGTVWKKGGVLTIDNGFSLEGYATDKTQVYFAGKASEIPDAVKRGHDLCARVQQALAERLRPGAVPSELYALALSMAEAAGLTEGFMGLGATKVRFLGHGIGLTIDGWPVLAKGFDAPLTAGMTLALEPKYGIPGVGMVGVENTFEVTAAGGKCLTGDTYDIICVD
ncbi:Xaa-Pro peptidase family protein [Solidesulfovibrio sp.]|uniref:M24 family metallopeptidase n=1 Tax=Solidesulfovibrio sp. TaxID=2910990 RepID=UPI002B20F1AA|nr:Xaa-Pro peptidase family protein [Solidesulfovibrio sp.]MEA4857061.1 Xaa-Pro peptidase family protein [Solidesulfovibrio sp.]